MTPPTIVFGREKKFRLGGTSFPTLEDFFLGPGSRTKYGYAGGNLTFGFSAGQFNVSAGYFATTSNQSTRYLYGCPYNASLQATVVDPGSTAAVSLDTATGDWTIDTSAPFLTLPAGYSMVAPTMGPSDSGDFTISMPSAATYYLLGNSSSSSITLDASQFPSGTKVEIWNGSGYRIFTVNDNGGWSGGVPTIAPNEAFFVLPSGPCTLTIPGVTGAPADCKYSLSDATVTVAGAPPVPFDNQQRLLTVYSWNGTSFERLIGDPDDLDITSWTGYAFYARQPLTVTFWGATCADYTTTTYDRLGRTLSTTDPRGVTHLYTYAPNAAPGAGQVTDDSVDLTNAPGVDNSVQSIATTYDDMGRVWTVTSYSGTGATGTVVNQVEDSYNGWGTLAEEWQNPDGQVETGSPAVQYVYEDGAPPSGTNQGLAAYLRLTDVTYPNGQEIDYNYGVGSTLPQAAVDAIMSRLSSISDNNSGATDAVYTYLGLDTIVTEDYQQSGVELNYDPGADNTYSGFDRFGRVLDQLWQQYGNTTGTADEESYTYGDADGNITQEQESATTMSPVSTAYTYDSMNRVTQWTQGSAKKSYTYDSLGNNTDATTGGAYNLDNEEMPNTGTACYDAAGNMITLSNGDTGVYDAWGRLVEADSGSNIVEQFEYDGTGRRVEVLSEFSGGTPGVVTRYYFSGEQVVETRVTGSKSSAPLAADVQYQYVWSPLYVNSPILRDTYSGGAVQPASRIFYLTDANYNITVVMGQNAGSWQVVERYRYDTYGNVTVCNPDGSARGGASNTTVGNTIFFAGESFDTATGLYFDNARYYDPQLGRFISQDPMGTAGSGNNLYAYCADNPTDAVDPFGLDDVTTEYYNVDGSYSQVQATLDKSSEWGTATWTPSWHTGKGTIKSKKEGDKWCVTIECAITFKAKNLKIRLPRWTGYSDKGTTDAERAAWDKMIKALTAHEQGHIDIFRKFDGTGTLTGSGSAPTRAEAQKNAWNAIQAAGDAACKKRAAEIDKLTHDYDTSTGCGVSIPLSDFVSFSTVVWPKKSPLGCPATPP